MFGGNPYSGVPVLAGVRWPGRYPADTRLGGDPVAVMRVVVETRPAIIINCAADNRVALDESKYFATIDAPRKELWVTLHGTVSKAVTLRVR